MLKSAALILAMSLVAPAAFASDAAHGAMASMQMVEVQLGDITIATPVIRATPPAAPAAGGFMTLTNTGTADDRLIAASVDASVAGMVQLHTMKMDGEVMRMSEIEGGIALPAGETVILAPGGLHIMLMNLPQGLSAGESYDVALKFETAGEVTVPFAVVEREALEAMGGGMKHGN
jgi:copper(I)-binding protein